MVAGASPCRRQVHDLASSLLKQRCKGLKLVAAANWPALPDAALQDGKLDLKIPAGKVSLGSPHQKTLTFTGKVAYATSASSLLMSSSNSRHSQPIALRRSASWHQACCIAVWEQRQYEALVGCCNPCVLWGDFRQPVLALFNLLNG